MKTVIRMSLCLLFLLVAAGVQAQRIDETMRNEDARLSTKFTFVGRHAYLGELLEAVAKQTGIKVRATDEDEAAGEELIAHLRNVPVADAMNALQSLLSYNGVTWAWERTKSDDDEWAYRLMRPKTADSLPRDIKKAVRQSFEDHANAVLQAAQRTDPADSSEKPTLGEMNQAYISNPRNYTGLKLFLQIPEDTRAKILRGEQILQVTINSLSEEGQSLARSMPRGSDATSLTFEVREFRGSITPAFLIKLDDSGYGYLGGVPLEAVWDKQIKQDWMRRLDSATHPTEKEPLGPDTRGRTDTSNPDTQEAHDVFSRTPATVAVPERLLQLARRNAVALLCRYPVDDSDNGWVNPGPNPTVGSLLMQFEQQSPHLIHKWHGDVLLLMPRDMVTTALIRKERVHWDTVKKLRAASLPDPDGLLPVDVLFQTASELTEEAFARTMVCEFENTRAIPKTQPLLAWFLEQPTRLSELLSPQGIKMNPTLNRLLQDRFRNRDTSMTEALAADKVTRVRAAERRRTVETGLSQPLRLMTDTLLYYRDEKAEHTAFLSSVGRCVAVPKKKAAQP